MISNPADIAVHAAISDAHHSQGSLLTVADTQVYNAAPPNSWTDLNLSGVVGSNIALVLLKISGVTGIRLAVRKNGDTDEFYNSLDLPMGASIGETAGGAYIAVLVATDASGIIEWRTGTTGTTVTVDVMAYIK